MTRAGFKDRFFPADNTQKEAIGKVQPTDFRPTNR